jgi:hypothetical protein
MSTTEKDVREGQATMQKQSYNTRLQDYRKTDNHEVYQQYLTVFRQSQGTKEAVEFVSHPGLDVVPEIVGMKSNVVNDLTPCTRPIVADSTAVRNVQGLKRAHAKSDMSSTTVIKGGPQEHSARAAAWASPDVIMPLSF